MRRDLTPEQISDYVSGLSVRELALTSELSPSAIRARLEDAGVLRNRSEATRVAKARGINLGPISRLTANENGSAYAAVLSQEWIRKPLGVSV